MTKEIIYAKYFLEKLDFYHLSKQFYKHIHRERLEEYPEWYNIRGILENFLVDYRSLIGIGLDVSDEEYREFLRFYTKLEIKYEAPTEFVFTKQEKSTLLNFLNYNNTFLKNTPKE